VICLKVIDSHCPGCSILCGVHIIEDDEGIDIEFMKSYTINSGKLCKFGIDLPKFYSSPRQEPYVYGKKVSYDDAIGTVADALKSWENTRGMSEGIILCTGDATCEELLVLDRLAKKADMVCATGLGKIVGMIGGAALLRKSSNFNIIEYAKSIVLVDIDPYYQYPLIARKLQIAKSNGAHIISIGTEKSHINHIVDEVKLIHPSKIQKELESLCESVSSETLFITSLGIYSDLSTIAAINNNCTKQYSRIMYMKDFANTEGSLVLGIDTKNNNIEGIIEGMESGKITALVLVESPLYDSYIDNERFRNACQNLQHLIILQSRAASVPNNAIMLPLPLFYERKGTLINVCGRLLSLKGDKEGVVGVNNDILKKLGAKKIGFETLTQETVDFYNKWKSLIPERSTVEAPKSTVDSGPCHKYISNPFLVRGLPYTLCKRVGKGLYPKAKKNERYVMLQDIAENVVLSYEKDTRFRKVLDIYE